MISKFLQREGYVVLHGQPRKFRIIKWVILVFITFVLYLWQGVFFVGLLWAILAVLGTSLHFFFRYKTKGWRQQWGPVKEIKTPFD